MEEIIKRLKEIKFLLAVEEEYNEAKRIKEMIERLTENTTEIRIENNEGQINFSHGDSVMQVGQTIVKR